MWFFCDFGYFDRLLEGNFFLIHFEGVSQVFLSKKCLSKGQKTIFWCQKCPATALPLNGGGRQGCTRGCSGVWHQLSLPNSSASSVITQDYAVLSGNVGTIIGRQKWIGASFLFQFSSITNTGGGQLVVVDGWRQRKQPVVCAMDEVALELY